MNQTQFSLSNNNYPARAFSERNGIPLNELHYNRKKMKEKLYWVCCVENGYGRGYKINEERYYIWLEGGQKLQALIRYLKEQEKAYA